MKLFLKMAVVAVLAVILLWFFTRTTDDVAQTEACVAETWINPLSGVDAVQFEPVSRDDYTVLRGQLQKQAWQQLKEAPFYRLTGEDIATAKIGERAAGEPYFLRAVSFNPEKNDILIGRKGDDYIVTHAGQGAAGAAKACWPVLIFLKNPPAKVFVIAQSEE